MAPTVENIKDFFSCAKLTSKKVLIQVDGLTVKDKILPKRMGTIRKQLWTRLTLVHYIVLGQDRANCVSIDLFSYVCKLTIADHVVF